MTRPVQETVLRLEAAEKEREMDEERIADLMADLNRVGHEIDALRAKITEMEKQEPVAWMHETRRDSDVVTDAVKHVWGKVAVGSMAAYSIPLYALPGAQTQPTPSIPEGWKLVPIEPTEDMLRAMTDPFIAINGDNRKAFEIAYTAMLSAAPEAKP